MQDVEVLSNIVEKDCQPLERRQEAQRLAMPTRESRRPCSGELFHHPICRAFP